MLESHGGEALGLLLALQWSLSLDFQRVIVEMDFKQVVDKIISSAMDVSEIDFVVSQCKNLGLV